MIIDYADTAEIEGYLPEIDRLAGRDGLAIRDEIRIVRPGFYLGRAYAGDRLLLTFTSGRKTPRRRAASGPRSAGRARNNSAVTITSDRDLHPLDAHG